METKENKWIKIGEHRIAFSFKVPADYLDEQSNRLILEHYNKVISLINPCKEYLHNIEKLTAEKILELTSVGRFFVDLGIDNVVEIKDGNETPDFFFKVNNEVIGLEHTFLIDPDIKKYFSWWVIVCDKAREILLSMNSELKGDYDLVIPYRNYSFKKKQIADKAKQLADYLISVNLGGAINKPDFVSKLRYEPNICLNIGIDEHFEKIDLPLELLFERISSKEDKFKNYKLNGSKCILLISMTGASEFSNFHIEEDKLPVIGNSNFSEIVLFNEFNHTWYVLKKAA